MADISVNQQLYMKHERQYKLSISIIRIAILIVFLIVWEVSARIGILNSFIFGSPYIILKCFIKLLDNYFIIYHTWITFLETVLSFILVTLVGIITATLLWLSPKLSKVLEPYLIILNSLPKSALAPLLIVWLGASMKTIIICGMSVAIFGTIINLHIGFTELDKDYEKLIYTLGGTKLHVLTKAVLPASVPIIFGIIKVNIGLCLVGVIIGEFLASKAGLGFLIIYGSQVFKLDWLLLSIIILCIMAMFFYKIVGFISKKISGH